MRIVFIRHGKPDYTTDTLTDHGWIQAHDLKSRLAGEGISEIYASTMGRAMQTATPFSEFSGIPIVPLSFMREVNWGPENDDIKIPFDGHPWLFIPEYIKSGKSLLKCDIDTSEDFKYNTKLWTSVNRVTEGFDRWLSSFGLVREGEYYRITNKNTDKTIAIFSHGGSSTAAISHLLNLSFLSACLFVRPYFTSVSVIKFEGNEGDLVMPTVELLNDDRHVRKESDSVKIEK